jgi:N-acetylneuraminic acid mutarotase
MWSFNTETNEWKLLWNSQASLEGDAPLRRSYHTMTTNGSSLFVFGGCSGKDRLEDTWEYHVAAGKWSKLTAGGPGVRGGSALVHHNGKLFVLFGFNGKELSDIWCLDLSHVAQGWKQTETSGESPGPRSVSAVGPIGQSKIIVFGGECEPSAQGHEGAGRYLEDTAVLDLDTLQWKKVMSSAHPTGRGWTASCPAGPSAFVVSGGFGGADRLGDMHIFRLDE